MHPGTREYATPEGAPHRGLYEEEPPDRGTFFRPKLYKGEGISPVEVKDRVGDNMSDKDL